MRLRHEIKAKRYKLITAMLMREVQVGPKTCDCILQDKKKPRGLKGGLQWRVAKFNV